MLLAISRSAPPFQNPPTLFTFCDFIKQLPKIKIGEIHATIEGPPILSSEKNRGSSASRVEMKLVYPQPPIKGTRSYYAESNVRWSNLAGHETLDKMAI